MANNELLKASIRNVIKANGKQAISGYIMQQTLVAIVDALGKGYQFMGIATPTTDPGTPDQKVFYIANGKGVYANFSGLNVNEDGLILLVYSDAWTKLLAAVSLVDGSVTTPKIANSAVDSEKLVKGARRPIILTPDTTEVDEATYQKLLSDDVDVVLKLDTGNLCLLTIKINRGNLLNLYFTCLSVEGLNVKNVYLYGYKFSITKNSPHNCSATQYISDTLYGLFELSNYLTKSALTPVPFTDTTLSNKAQLEAFLSKVPDATVMHCTYKEIWAGTLHKINGDWYGLLVKNTNNPADNINIKLSANGTVITSNSAQ